MLCDGTVWKEALKTIVAKSLHVIVNALRAIPYSLHVIADILQSLLMNRKPQVINNPFKM